MNKEQVKAKVTSGNLIDCSAEEYTDVRRYLQEFAGESVDNGQIIYTQIALNEVARLDKKFAAVEHSVQRIWGTVAQNEDLPNEKTCATCGHSESRHQTAGGFCKHCTCNEFVDPATIPNR
jgi:hypothetical protein